MVDSVMSEPRVIQSARLAELIYCRVSFVQNRHRNPGRYKRIL